MPTALAPHPPAPPDHRRLAALAHSRRAWAVLALAATGAAVGGLGAVLLGFLAVLLALDALLPVPGSGASAADERFRRMVRARRREERARRLRGLPPERLEVLDDRAGWAATAERRALGVQPVAVETVVGTVEERKARDFDRRFRPDAAAAGHWRRLWLAQATGGELPPIAVYRVGGRHIVRDGHHRVSIARDLGLDAVEADVIELRAR